MLALASGFAAGCGDDEEPASETRTSEPPDAPRPPEEPNPLELAAIDPTTGAYQGLKPDTREGIEPAEGAEVGPLQAAARSAGCTLRLNLRDEGNEHLEEGRPAPNYGTNPPTSGPHQPVPLADGAYLESPPAENAVHSLEHGRIAIQYDPALPEGQQLLLKGLFFADPDGVVLFPNPDMPYAVAVTAWRNLMGCREFGEPEALTAAILAFRDRFRGKGPERIPL